MDEIKNVVRRGGRGGIRTHGGFPHARFRVECLKPDSATLPIARYCQSYFRMRNFQTIIAFTNQSMTRAWSTLSTSLGQKRTRRKNSPEIDFSRNDTACKR